MRFALVLLTVLATAPAPAQPVAPRGVPTSSAEERARAHQREQDARDERILDSSRRATGLMCSGCGVDPALTGTRPVAKPTRPPRPRQPAASSDDE
jgi:hypothetical protein